MDQNSKYEKILSRLVTIEKLLSGQRSPWLTLVGASYYACVSESTIRRWIKTGNLIPRRVGRGRILLHRRDIDAVIFFGKTKISRAQRKVVGDYEI